MQVVIADLTGLDVHWYVWGVASIVACFLMARSGVDVSSRILGVCLILEISVLVVFDVAVLLRTGFDVTAFSPATVVAGSLPIGLLLAATGFLGFEATSLFSEEARSPLTTIPRATYTAIVAIGVILGVTTWAVVSAAGVADAQQVGLDHLANGDLLFSLAQEYLGSAMVTVMEVLLLVSLFAAMLAFHNSATRYLYSLGRARVLPQAPARTRGNGAPQLAGAVQAGFAIVVAGIFAVAGSDPITGLVPPTLGFGTLSIIVLQAMAAAAIIVHFRRHHDSRVWATLVAPGIGLLGLSTITVLAIANFDVVAGSDSPAVAALPLLLLVTAVVGLVYGAWLQRSRPAVYDGLVEDIERFNVHRTDPQEQPS